MTYTPVTSIEWRDQSFDVLISIVDNMMVEYNISSVTDDLQGQQFTCVAVAVTITYTETAQIHVEGKCPHAEQHRLCMSHPCTPLQSLMAFWMW